MASLLFIFQRGISAQNTSNVDKKISSLTGSIYRRVKSVLQQQQSTNSTDIMKAKVLGYEIPEITANTKMLYALISFIDTKTYSTELSSTLKLIVQYETLVQYEDFLNETIFKSKNNKNYLNKIKNIFLKIDSSLNELNISSKDKKEIQESLNKIRSPNYPKEAFKKLKNCLTYDIANNYLLPYDNSSDCYSFNKSFEYYKTLIDCNLPIPLL